MNNLEIIGEKIKKIRKSKKISQEKLAEMVLMNHRSIVRIENKHTLPTIETLNKIAGALNVSILDFFEKPKFNTREEIILDINNIINKLGITELEKIHKIISIISTN